MITAAPESGKRLARTSIHPMSIPISLSHRTTVLSFGPKEPATRRIRIRIRILPSSAVRSRRIVGACDGQL